MKPNRPGGGQLELPGSLDNKSGDKKPPQPPPEEPKPVHFRGYIQRLGCQPKIPSEIYSDSKRKTENFFLEESSQQKVEANPQHYARKLIDFVTCPGKPGVISLKKDPEK